ncbi:MAG: glycosyltransferase family 39 protein [Verrucomicrobia bacterium]|nr:glycosyltransferase family 39 protein [Verrucomicrobiota bacterium]
MPSTSAGEQRSTARLFGQEPWAHALLVAALLVVGFGVRLYRIDEPPLEFHAYRQYRSALIARAYYFDMVRSVPEWRREIAGENKNRQGIWEPPVMEWIAALSYRLIGGEALVIPRVLSCLFWITGGVFLYRIARRGVSANAAVLSLGCYLFLPFGIRASRTFMPEPLMFMLTLWALDAMVRYLDAPSLRRLLVGAGVAALAVLVKPIGLFMILGAFACLILATREARRLVIRPGPIAFMAIALLPAAVYYSYTVFISGSLSGMAGKKILPHLLVQVSYWSGCAAIVQQVVGYGAFLGALVGVLLIRDALYRGLVVGLWLGYVVFALIFSYTVHTHDYWSLQLVPIVALSLGSLFDVVLRALGGMGVRWPRRALVNALGVLAIGLGAGQVVWTLRAEDFRRLPAIGRQVGELVEHSRRTVFLSSGHGKWLLYYGEIEGSAWPVEADLRARELRGQPQWTAAERLRRVIASEAPEYFIVTDMAAYDLQPELRELLTNGYPALVRTDDYVIFDLRRLIERD